MQLREKLTALVESRAWEIAILSIIIINAITLGLETSQPAMASFGRLLEVLDKAVLTIFVVEIAIRIYVYRLGFFRRPWSLFDFAVVTIALMPATGALSVLRALRILRVLRLISAVPSLQRVVGGLIAALPGMGSIVVLMVLVFYVFSVMATKSVRRDFPTMVRHAWRSAYSLFQIMTLESWSMGIVRPVMESYPLAWAFFVPFILSRLHRVEPVHRYHRLRHARGA